MRDQQRSKIYAAERAAAMCYDPAPLMSWSEVERFVSKVCRAEKYIPPKIGHGQGARRAFCKGHRIVLPRWARQKWVILHELSHWMTRQAKIAHGEQFLRVYLHLINRYIGQVEAQIMVMALNQYRVK